LADDVRLTQISRSNYIKDAIYNKPSKKTFLLYRLRLIVNVHPLSALQKWVSIASSFPNDIMVLASSGTIAVL
jgi:hypothetical protein